MDFSLDDEQALVVATVRRFVDKELAARAADADRAGAPPERFLDRGADVGFFLDAVPAEADGLLEGAYCHLTRALRAVELGRGCAGLAALLESNVEPALAVGRWGSPAARDALFSSLAKGGLATFAYDAQGTLAVTARGDDLVLGGALGPVPVLAAAGHLLLCARAGGEPIVALVAADAVELEALTPSGWRAARWARLRADGAVVPAEMVLARGDAGAAATGEILTWYRANLAARAAGVSIAAMAHAQGYAAERVQFGQPIGAFESIIRLRDRSETAAAATRLLALQAAWQIDAGHADAADTASRARDLAGDTVAAATIDAVQIYGGYGFVNDYPVEKLMRDARAFEVLCGNEAFERVLAQAPQRLA
jgi:butyryl-CoA dehydrogenase